MYGIDKTKKRHSNAISSSRSCSSVSTVMFSSLSNTHVYHINIVHRHVHIVANDIIAVHSVVHHTTNDSCLSVAGGCLIAFRA